MYAIMDNIFKSTHLILDPKQMDYSLIMDFIYILIVIGDPLLNFFPNLISLFIYDIFISCDYMPLKRKMRFKLRNYESIFTI